MLLRMGRTKFLGYQSVCLGVAESKVPPHQAGTNKILVGNLNEVGNCSHARYTLRDLPWFVRI